jgi:hypothetical protein
MKQGWSYVEAPLGSFRGPIPNTGPKLNPPSSVLKAMEVAIGPNFIRVICDRLQRHSQSDGAKFSANNSTFWKFVGVGIADGLCPFPEEERMWVQSRNLPNFYQIRYVMGLMPREEYQFWKRCLSVDDNMLAEHVMSRGEKLWKPHRSLFSV